MPKTKETPLYTEPETEYEYVEETKRIGNLRRGDNVQGWPAIGEIIHGHKYLTIKDSSGKQILRELATAEFLNSEVQVRVRRQTPASRAADRRYDGNISILRELRLYEQNYVGAKERFHARWEEWGALNYDFVGSLLNSEAKYKLWAAFAANIEYELEQGKDHVQAMTDFVAMLKDRILKGYLVKGISRSSNQLSNLMEDVSNEAMIEFIQESRWYGVPQN